MKKVVFLALCIMTFAGAMADPIHLRPIIPPTTPSSGDKPHKAPLLMPSAYCEDDAIYVTYPYTTVMTVSVCKDDDTFYTEQTFYAVSTASIGGLAPGTYTLTVTIGGIVYEGEFEVEEE